MILQNANTHKTIKPKMVKMVFPCKFYGFAFIYSICWCQFLNELWINLPKTFDRPTWFSMFFFRAQPFFTTKKDEEDKNWMHVAYTQLHFESRSNSTSIIWCYKISIFNNIFFSFARKSLWNFPPRIRNVPSIWCPPVKLPPIIHSLAFNGIPERFSTFY